MNSWKGGRRVVTRALLPKTGSVHRAAFQGNPKATACTGLRVRRRCVVDGRSVYLGEFGSDESKRKYEAGEA